MIVDIISNEKLNQIVTELFIRGRKLNISTVFISQYLFHNLISTVFISQYQDMVG